MWDTYIKALALIFIAEMGDKTQILAMSFATRFKVRHVLLGVAIGVVINHGLAIALGSLITQFVSFDLINLIAGVIFLLFGFLSLKVDNEDEDDEEGGRFSKLGPILTVAAAFFVGELGDKTQLTALTLSAGNPFPLVVLLGTVSGMVLTSIMGIVIGMKLGKKIPEMQLKLGACAIFLFFGVQKIMASSYLSKTPLTYSAAGIALVVLMALFLGRRFTEKVKVMENTRLKRKAEMLYQHTHQIKAAVESMCLGLEHCEVCSGEKCLIGNLKMVLNRSLEQNQKVDPLTAQSVLILTNKNFSKETAKQILGLLTDYYGRYHEEYIENTTLTNVRMTIERILWGEVLELQMNYEAYERMVHEKLAQLS